MRDLGVDGQFRDTAVRLLGAAGSFNTIKVHLLGQNSSKSRNKTSSLLGGRVLTDAFRFYYAHHNIID